MSLCFICLSPTVGHARRSFRTCETTGKAVFIKDFQFTVAYIHYLAESMVLPSNFFQFFFFFSTEIALPTVTILTNNATL